LLRVDYRSGGKEMSIECDYLACGFGLIANTELPQLLGCTLTPEGFVRVEDTLRTTVPNVYAVGELVGIGGVEKAIVEGCLAASAITGQTDTVATLVRQRAKALTFSRNLAEAFALRPELLALAAEDTIICRCEDVRLSAVRAAMSGRDAKLQTRCGMGPCQARVCGPILQRLLNTEPPHVRPPILCTTIGTLAACD
jgi:pyruvate/2-oxoglutarate dehydrogenase complex dihydrolipoamide dehydrogenase (E3) component